MVGNRCEYVTSVIDISLCLRSSCITLELTPMLSKINATQMYLLVRGTNDCIYVNILRSTS